MSANTGENEQGLRKIVDMTRLISIGILLLHFYYFCYSAFDSWQWTSVITNKLLSNIKAGGFFNNFNYSKLLSLGFLLISLVGAKGKKDEKLKTSRILTWLIAGLLLYLFSSLAFRINLTHEALAISYMTGTTAGFLLVLSSGTRLSRLLQVHLSKDIFNTVNESFPQEERFLLNEYSINLPAQYNLKDKIRKSWINIINPFRGLLVIGSPGSGKSWFVIQHIIKQHIEKGFAMFIYDFKYDDLSRIAYNSLLKYKHKYAVQPSFHVINFDNLSLSNRCNPLDPSKMSDITDVTESARTILLGLNREWINKQGDFFVESPINFMTAIIWFLRKYENGKYCTLPHVIELMQANYDELFPVLNTQAEIEVLVNPFITAYENDAMEQLEGQVASAKIGMARLASPQLYWVLSGNDFTLDINDSEHPKIVCIGNNPEKQQVYGAVLSLYISRLIKQGKYLCRLGFPFPEFNNFKHNTVTDDIEWTNVGKQNSPIFPIDGIITRFIGDETVGVTGIEMSTPGLQGQSGGPLFDVDGNVYGMQFATNHLHLGFDVKDMEIINGGKKTKVSNSPFLHVGHCIHVGKIKEFLKEHKINFTESK